MSYTDQTLTNDAFEKLKALNPQAPASLIPRLRAMVPSALIQMAERVSRSSLADLLRTTFTETAVDGVAPLTSVAASEPLLLDSKLEVFLTGSTHPLEPVPDRETLQLESSIDFGFYCIEGLNIHVKAANGEYETYDGTVTIIGTRIPLSSTIPLQLQGEALDTLVRNLVPQQGAD